MLQHPPGEVRKKVDIPPRNVCAVLGRILSTVGDIIIAVGCSFLWRDTISTVEDYSVGTLEKNPRTLVISYFHIIDDITDGIECPPQYRTPYTVLHRRSPRVALGGIQRRKIFQILAVNKFDSLDYCSENSSELQLLAKVLSHGL